MKPQSTETNETMNNKVDNLIKAIEFLCNNTNLSDVGKGLCKGLMNRIITSDSNDSLHFDAERFLRCQEIYFARPRKSWRSFDDFDFMRSVELTPHVKIPFFSEEPSTELTLDDVIHWNHDHTDFIRDIEPIVHVFHVPMPVDVACGKRNLNNDNKTQLERLIKRRK